LAWFDILLVVGNSLRQSSSRNSCNFVRSQATAPLVFAATVLASALALSAHAGSLIGGAERFFAQAPAAAAIAQAAPSAQSPTSVPSPSTTNPAAMNNAGAQTASAPQRTTPSIVVLDPAHGGTDPGARGTGGIRESEVVLEFAAQVKTALESLGFQVMPTRQGNENPSFDDRSAIANAQRGAIFVTLHVASTGLPGTVRVYVMSDLSASSDASGLIPWERAQAPFLPLSRRFGDLVQGFLAQRFKGSPNTAEVAAVRQLRTTAAPAIAVEVSSVSVDDRGQLDRMAPGVADAIARGASAFRPSYVVATNPGERP
jgi:N-acetylmuramoyl-L-alanine amidase